MRASTALVCAFSLAAAIALPAPAQEQAMPEWSQEKAAQLARLLADEVSDIRVSWNKAPPGSQGARLKQRQRLRDDLYKLKNSTRKLARELESGKNREETLPSARRVGVLIRDARTSAAGSVPSIDLEQKITSAEKTIERLAAMYGASMDDVVRKTGASTHRATPATPD